MFASIEAKLIAAAVLLLAMVSAVIWFGAHERGIGAAGVQTKWDAANATQTVVAVKASETARATENRQANDFAGIASGYLQATTHAYPSLADALPASVAAGTMRLRDTCRAPGSSGMSEAAAHSRVLDAASTQALADRVAAAIEIVRIGDAGDARELRLGAQVTALQALLVAERKPSVLR
jgi:hypothetical protein